ncbi:hypothetical protein OWM54_20525 [Myxococcus sp. MISCRS1]|jgi:hypothetical protein|uniref:hypothetical protein n=1 Tax=Myxococcus TaxID=32 RepID=UPI0011447007|nr:MULTISPECIES: hypothetical protein [Myxococcus]BDT38680.1 hypothetical protein MFMH1_83490 [Myxococcus sp. MH1]MBZ4399029.1 hypothetical protein [Myxococcus sp. AS-1-15]MBZ4413374.1 hypothetical protein [Myxococcus sp. XM-1-1-1]MCK8499687.1 hypothetical protein [Myxococcus fulvus]MCY0999523.1 hypothetical protein [Myxococcus sp. MISCRS1]
MAEVRELPRVSVNKLGEYLTATPARRKRIIYDQKHPPEQQYLRYPEASLAITDFLCRDLDPAILREHQRRFACSVPQSEFEAQRLHLCSEALERFADLVPWLGLEDTIISPVGAEPPVLEMAGVTISVRPEVVLQRMDRHGNPRVGLMKLYFSKHHPLDERSGQYIGTMLQRFAEQHLCQLGPSDHRMVQVVDVFAGTLFTAPRAHIRRLSDVVLACEEIAERWAVH